MKEYSYWLDTINKDFLIENDLPKKTDVLIVGFGYTGLNAAIEIAKNGRSRIILEIIDVVIQVDPHFIKSPCRNSMAVSRVIFPICFFHVI